MKAAAQCSSWSLQAPLWQRADALMECQVRPSQIFNVNLPSSSGAAFNQLVLNTAVF